MSVGNLKDQGGKGTNHPYQLNNLRGLEKIISELIAGASISGDILDDLNDIKNYIDTLLPSVTYTPNVIDVSSLSLPYNFPSATYKSFSIVVPSGSSIDFNGVTLIPGVYNFAGVGNQTSGTFVLDTLVGTGVYILTVA
jgi:hypothetical protein